MFSLSIDSLGLDSSADITDVLAEELLRQDVRSGMAVCCVVGSTAGLVIMRYEPGALEDLMSTLDSFAPKSRCYRHGITTGDPNGASHVKATLIGSSVSVPIIDKKIAMSASHRIVLLDFDLRPAKRSIFVQVCS